MNNDGILEFILRNIWPMIAKNICRMDLFADEFHRMRKFVPSILNDCPLLRVVFFYMAVDFFTEFPVDDSAMASDGQAMAKWLFTPLPDDVPKVFNCVLKEYDGSWPLKIEAFKSAFANASSSPVNFIVVIWCSPSFADFVVPFDLINELTREQLVLKTTDEYSNSDDYSTCFLLVRCPIVRDVNKWAKWEKEAMESWQMIDHKWNKIDIQFVDDDDIEDGLLNAMIGPSDQQK
ncbi:hypothetical protein niasHT_031168 [Heterodera trifolii]|uniref:Uncharacterized protein n=1 Tax=Heterodera trifolii TaxID=157864 RepID=A0ABD2I5V3_9BILA